MEMIRDDNDSLTRKLQIAVGKHELKHGKKPVRIECTSDMYDCLWAEEMPAGNLENTPGNLFRTLDGHDKFRGIDLVIDPKMEDGILFKLFERQ